jgi:hypothetical protein
MHPPSSPPSNVAYFYVRICMGGQSAHHVELQTLSGAERRGGAVGPSQTHLLGKCRLALVLEGVGRDISARAEVGYHVHIRVRLLWQST